MASYLWKRYAEHLYTKWEKTFLWDSIEHYRRPTTFTPLVILYTAAFYTGVVGAAITEQLYKVITFVLVKIECILGMLCYCYVPCSKFVLPCKKPGSVCWYNLLVGFDHLCDNVYLEG